MNKVRNQISSFINEKVNDLKKEQKHNKIKYSILASILTLTNFATIIVAFVAIYELLSTEDFKGMDVLLASSSAALVIILFFLHNFSVVYKAIMNDRKYKNAIDAIQHEVIKFNLKKDSYASEDGEKILLKNVEKIQAKAYKLVDKKSKASLFIRAVSGGGEDV